MSQWREFDLKQADEIFDEYSKPYRMIDNGNLFFALGEYKEAYETKCAEVEEFKAKYNFMLNSAQQNAKERDKAEAESDRFSVKVGRLNVEIVNQNTTIRELTAEVERLKETATRYLQTARATNTNKTRK
jgi:chromosome segregation ATPase